MSDVMDNDTLYRLYGSKKYAEVYEFTFTHVVVYNVEYLTVNTTRRINWQSTTTSFLAVVGQDGWALVNVLTSVRDARGDEGLGFVFTRPAGSSVRKTDRVQHILAPFG